jgi:DNA topoisomerase-1
MDYSFTAKMEGSLDDVADDKLKRNELLNQFYQEFSEKLSTAHDPDDGMRGNSPTETNLECLSCARHMQIRTGTTGVFLGCSGYALPPKERCKTTMNLVSDNEVVSTDYDEEAEVQKLLNKKRCGLCNTAMDGYLVDESTKLHICGNNPDCEGYEIELGSYKIKGYDGPVIECDKCSNEMQLKTGRFGKYFGCTNEACKNTRKLLRSGEAAPPKMDPVPMPELQCLKVDDTYILRDGASGLFLAASQFPKNRETRAPLVAEILPHKNEIDPKYNFLFSAPVADNDGVATLIRFSRKTQEQYVQSEVDGKATGWKAFYDNGKWTISTKPLKTPAKKLAVKKTAKKVTKKSTKKAVKKIS